MKAHRIKIEDKWAFVLAYDIGDEDLDEVGGWLEALGAGEREVHEAQLLLTRWNKGFTRSDTRLRMSVMCIGKATSDEQWWDTLIHEIDHLQGKILRYYDVSQDTEDAAYLQGYMMRKIIQVLKADGYRWGHSQNI